MTQARKRSSPLITALEPRMLLDGAALTTAEQTLADTPPPPYFEQSDDPAHQIIVVDASVPNADELIANIAPGWTVVRLSADRDGLVQLEELLVGRNDLQALHIFSHGDAGLLTLGSGTLSTDTLASRAPELAALGSHLTVSGDLMIYGCGVAADFAGQTFVSRLAALTHADVAASDDATGSLTLGGDWELENQTGTIDTATLSSSQYNGLLPAGNATMDTGEASETINFSSNRYSPRLYWQASGAGGYGNTGDTAWVDQYTGNQVVKYWGTGWYSISYPAWRWGWFPIYIKTDWFSFPTPKDWNYGSGTRYATQSITLQNDSSYQFDVSATTVYKDNHGQLATNPGWVSLNTALYKGSFDPTDPLKNLVTASEGLWWPGGGQLQKGGLSAGNYIVVSSFDTTRWVVAADNNVWWSSANNYAQQLWGDFRLTVTNLNRAPVWTTRDLSQTLDGAGVKTFTIPPALSGNITLSDADGDALTVTATLANGSALPSWLSFDAQSMTFTGNPPANTGTLAVRLSATDGQLVSTRDFTITYTNDNDQPVVAALIPDQAWNGAGGFSYTIPLGTFTDSDPSGSNLSYTATLTDGSALPNWLSFNANTRTLSGNPPANFASFDIRITVDDGSGQANAAQSDTVTLTLANNNDIPTVTDITKSVVEDGTLSFSTSDFVYSDLDTHASNDTTVGSGRTLQSVRILGLPANGTLWLDTNNNGSRDSGEDVLANQVIAYASLGLLRYTPRADWAGGTGSVTALDRSTSPDSFTWTATDGVNDAAAPATTRINVTLVNDAPLLAFSEGRTLIVRPNTGNALATPVYVDRGLQVADADALYTSDTAFDTIYGATVSVVDSVSNTFQSGDVLAATAGSGITVSYDSATGTLKLSGTATAAAYQSVLRTLQFSSSNTGNDNLRDVSIVLRTADVGSKTSAVFDGVNDYVETQRGSIPMTGDYSLSVWARFDGSNIADGSQYTILSQGGPYNGNFFIQLARVGSNYNLRLGDGWTVSNGFPMDGKWHQFTVVKSGNASGNGTLYIDGIKTATGNLSSVEGNSLRIGRLYRLTDTTDYDAYWQGAISDLRIYDRTLNLGEINTSLDSAAALTGYEANLLAWYPLLADFDNHAVTTWDFGRDYNPYNPSLSQGPWSMGVVTGNSGATGNFNAAAFQALSTDTAKITTGDKYVQYENAYFPYHNTANGWGAFVLPNNTAEGHSAGTFNVDPGVVSILPGYVNPAALQFAAPVAGVYSVDARFWSIWSDKTSGWPTYKVFRVAANGTVTELTGAGGTVAGTTAANAAVSGLKQVVLNAGEKLLFAVHKGDAAAVAGDEVATLIRCDLLAAKTADGTYYSLEDGHYYGLSSTTTNSWDSAASGAASLSTAGQTGYLATPTSATAARIAGALVQRSYEDGGTPPSGTSYEYAYAGFKQINKNAEPGGNWFWATGPEANQPFDGQWATGEPNNSGNTEDHGSIYRTGSFKDLGSSNNYRYLVEFGGAGRLAAPVELTSALSLTRDQGNALVYKDAGVAWSARTGHYYRLTGTASDFTTANGATYTYDGVSGYLARLASLSETDLAAYQLRLGSASGAWVGLQSSDPASNGQLVWKWNSGPAAATVLDPSVSRTNIPTLPAGQVLIAYDDFQNGPNGWVWENSGSGAANTLTDGLTTADGTANKVMGNYSIWTRKAYEINNQETTISFVVNRLDSWDNEYFYVRLRSDVDGFAKYDQFNLQLFVHTNYSNISPTLANEAGGSRTVRLALGDVTVTPIANYGNFTYSGYTDQSFRVTLKLNANYGDSALLYFGSSLDTGGTDESYSIDNVALYQAANTTNTNVGLGGTLDTFTDPTGWDNDGRDGSASGSKWGSYTTINGDRALWFGGSGTPTKTFQINNQATRIEFDAYTLDSWDNEWFYTYINGSELFTITRVMGSPITSAWSNTAMLNGKVVNYTVTPGTYGEFYGTSGWNEQKFHVVIDLPEDFGSTFELTFDTSLDSAMSDESAAVDNVQVYSRDNAGWIDSRGTLTADNNAASTPSFAFNGSDSHLNLGTLSGLGGDYTMEAWVYVPSTAQSFGRIFDLGNGADSNNIWLGFDALTGKIALENLTGTVKTKLTTSGTLPINQWVHIAAVNKGDGTGAIYFNGILQNTTGSLAAAPTVDRTTNYAGRSNWTGDAYFLGQMKDLRIWNDARTQAEIQANMAQLGSADLQDANLLGNWAPTQLSGNTVNDLSSHNQDATAVNLTLSATDPLRLDQFRSFQLFNVTRYLTDDDWNIKAIATDGKSMYVYYGANNYIIAFGMDGVAQRSFSVAGSTLGDEEVQMAYSAGWLYFRNPGAVITAGTTDTNLADDKIYRVSPVDGSYVQVAVDSSHPLLGGVGWAAGSLFNMPDGRLGIVTTNVSTGATTVRLYTLADNGTRLVWSQDYSLNIGAGWLTDSHGTTSDGRYLYILRYVNATDKEYKVFDLTTGALAVDGTPYNLWQQAVDNATFLTRDPLTGDIYFADNLGSHLARVQQPASAQRLSLVEYGAEGTALAAPLLLNEMSALPDRFVSDTRSVQVRVGNTAPTASNWSASTAEDTALTLSRSQFAAAFSDPELDTLYSIILQSVPASGAGTLSLNGVALAANDVIYAGELDLLVFTPVANSSGSASFSYKASDGNLTSAAAATVTLTVTAANDAPVLATAGSPTLNAIAEDVADGSNTGTTVADLVIDSSITDVDAAAPEAIAVTRVDNTHGVWQYNTGSGWVNFSNVSGAIVDLGADSRLLDSANSVRFVPAADWNGTVNLYYRAWDKSAGAAGGTTNPNALGGNTAVSTAEEAASLTVSAVNDAPTSVNASVTMPEDTAYTLGASNFGFSDVDAGNTLQSVTITTLPQAGTLTLNGNAVQANDVISIADLNAGNLRFTPAANAYGSPYTTIGFSVGDGALSSSAQTLTFNVTDANDAPTAIAWSTGGSVAENSAADTVVGKLSATDPNTGDTLRFARVSNSNFSISPDGTVTVSNLAALDFERTATQTLRVRVTDSGGLTYEQDVTVTLSDVVESAPTLIANSFYIAKGGSVTISESQLKAVDAQTTDPAGLTYTVKEAPTGGTWWIDADGDSQLDAGEALAPVNDANPDGRDTFTHAEVIAGKLRFIQDGTQSNSKLSLSLSDGTAASSDANGNPVVTGSLVAIVSSPPVVAPVSDQQWSTSGAQTFTLPSNTFTDPDLDQVAVSATLADGSALPSWLSFNASTWTFSGTPVGYTNGQSIAIRVSGTDGRSVPINDEFNITFSTTLTAPVISNPIANQVFDGAGSKSFLVPANTFTARGSNTITGYTASNLPSWLSFNTGTQTFSGNPPQSAEPGPYWITVTANTASGGSTSAVFRLIVTNANDQPVERSPNNDITDKTISDADEHSWTLPSNAFTDGDSSDTLTLRAANTDGTELPSWVRFDPATRTFTAKAPSGSGSLVVRVFADDGLGGSGYADFTITYSGGANLGPKVLVSSGLWYMDAHIPAELATTDNVKAQQFSLSQGTSAAITRDHLREMDPDDDGDGLTYTLTRLPTNGQLWLDSDGDGTLNGAETTLNVGGTFTQADIDAGKLRYRHTGTTSATTTVNDSFKFNLADGHENGAVTLTGVTFSITATPLPAAPTLMTVLRSSPSTALTNADSVSFEVGFSEAVSGVGTADFAVTGTAATGNVAVQSVSTISGARYLVTVGGSDLANASGKLGLSLVSSSGTVAITNRAGNVNVDANHLTAMQTSENYTLDNTAPAATLTAPALYGGTGSAAAFWVKLNFAGDAINDFAGDAINDFSLADLEVSSGNATLSDFQHVAADTSGTAPAAQPTNFDPLTYNANVSNRDPYWVKVTPTSGTGNIVVQLKANSLTDDAGNANAAASVTVVRNSAPTVTLDAAAGTPATDHSATFTELDGADTASNDVAFTTAGTTLADANTSQNLAWLNIAIANTQITDGAAETLRVNGTAIALNFADGAAIADITLGSTTYSVTASVVSGTRSLSFAKSGGGTLTLAQAEALLDALTYNNSSDSPTAATRSFAVSVNDGMETSSAANFTVTVAATNDTPVISIGSGDSAGATRAETNTTLTANGTLSVLDRDVSNTAAVSKVGVVASGTTAGLTSNNAALLAMLSIDSGNVISSTSTAGTLHWAFDSGSQAFDYLAAGETLTLTYTVRATDSHTPTAASDDQTVIITITGSNDAPKVTASSVSALSNGAPLTAAGAISFSDPDSSDRPTVSITASSITATLVSGSLGSDATTALQNALSLTTTTPNANPGNAGWSYSLDPSKLKLSDNTTYIAQGGKVKVTYTVTFNDTHGGTTTQDLTFTVIGTGNGGTLVVSGDTGSIVEGSPSTLSDAGSLTFNTYPSFASVSVDTSPSITASSLTLTDDQKNAIKAGFAASYVDNASTDAAAWTYSISEGALDFLPDGETVTAVFAVKIYDSAATPNLLATQNVTIIIQGANDAPVIDSTAADAEGSVTEASTGVTDTASGTLTASDLDTGASKTWSVNATGTYGSLAINPSTGIWTYTLDNADADTQALAAGASAVETFSATVSDGVGGTATQQIRVTVTGSNDAPVLTAPGTVATYTDTSGNDSFTTPTTGSATGTLSLTDTDAGDSWTYAITGQSADTSRSGFTHSKAGSHGTLYLNALSGAYAYVPDAAKMNAATATVNDDFSVKATDAAGTDSNTATLSVTISGVNDTPTLAKGLGSDAASLDEADSGLTASGYLTAGDLDTSQNLTVSKVDASCTAQLNAGSAATMDSTQLGWLTFGSGTLLSNASSTSEALVWNFNSGSAAFNSLRAGDTLTLTYTVRVGDGAATADKTVTVTIHGSNDAPVISIDNASSADSASAGLTENSANPLVASGTLTVADAEAGDTLTASVANVAVSGTAPRAAAPSDTALLAMLKLPSASTTTLLTDGIATLATHGLAWEFKSGSTTFDQLAAGETLVLTYTLRVVDDASGAPGMDTQTVTITLTGSNDAPTVTAGDVSGSIASGFPAQLFDSGSISFTDIDLNDLPTASATPLTITGALRGGAAGSLPLSSAQQTAIANANAFSLTAASGNTHDGVVGWDYVINQADIDFLGSGQTVTAVFRVTVNDGHGGTAFQDVTLTIAGQNNAPVITVVGSDSDSKALTETNAALSTSGTLTVTDTNLTDAVTATVLSGTVKRNSGSITTMASGDARLNWLTLTPSTVLSGSSRSAASGTLGWNFSSTGETFNDLAAGETLTLTYTIRVTDDAPSPSTASDTQTVTLTITGSNDAPTITLVGSDSATANLAETNAALSGSGTLTVGDLDTANTVTASVHAIAVSGTSNRSDPAAPSDAELKAMLALNPTAILDNTHTSASLGWTFNSGNEQFNYLAAGETLVLDYTVRVTDSEGVTADRSVTVTLTGSNDAPTVSGGPVSDNLAETDAPLSALGTLTVGDLDTSNSVVASRTLAVGGSSNRSDLAAPNDAALLAMLQLSPTAILDNSHTSGTLDWAFNSGTEKFNYLAAGETLVLTYTVTVADNNNPSASATTTITLTVTGSNDAPVISVGSSDHDSAALTETDAALSAQGTLSVADVDTANTVAPSVLSVAASGVTAGLPANNAALKAMLTVDTVDVIGSSANAGVIHWAFASGSEHFNYLAAGEQLVLTYTVRASDSSSGSGDSTVTVTVTGSNDAPTVSIATPAAIAEATDAHAQALNRSGNVAFADLDASDLIDVAFSSDNNLHWSGGVLDSTLAQALVNGFSVSATNAAVSATVNWSYDVNAVDLDFLAADETITFSYTVFVTDAQGQQVTAPVAFTLTGANDAPLLAAVNGFTLTDTASADHFASVSGSLASSDRDANDSATYAITGDSADVSRSGFDRSVTGTYGTLYLNSATGAYSYVPNDAAINALTGSASDSFTLSVGDGSAASASQTLAVTLVAANDTPQVSASLISTTYVDTNASDTFSAVTGTLTGSDRDSGASLDYAIVGQSADTSLSGFTHSKAGNYGTLYLNSSTRAYTYVPDATAINALNSNASDAFAFEVSDGSASSTTAFTVFAVGAGDAPVISEGSASASLLEINAALRSSGTLTVTDNDLTDSVNLSTSVNVGGTSSATHPANADLLAMLSLSPTSVLADANSISSQVSWAFNSGNQTFDYLAAGETLVLTYAVTATDTGNPALATSSTVIVTLIGSNDSPTLAQPTTITLTDTVNADTLANTAGSLSGSDVDHNAVLSYGIAGQSSGTTTINSVDYNVSKAGRYGTLYLNATTGAYVYVPNTAAIETLKAGASELFSVWTSDGSETATQSLAVNIAATNDVPTQSASVAAHTYTDTANDNSFATFTGRLTGGDREGDRLSYSVAGEVSQTNLIDGIRYDSRTNGTYGVLYLNSVSGDYRFEPNDLAIEQLKAGTSEAFSLLVSDGALSTAQTLTLTLAGSNDTPALAAVNGFTLTDTASADHFASVSGSLASSDRDANDSATYAATGAQADVSRSGFDRSVSGTYGTLYLNSATGAYSYIPNDAAINALTADASENFTLSVSDGSNASASQTLAVTLVAANDTPQVSASLISTTYVDTNASDTFSAVTGTLTGTDRDTGATFGYAIVGGSNETNAINSVTYDSKRVGSYGTLYLVSGTGAYTYVPDATAINALNSNASDAFAFEVSDGSASSTTAFTVFAVGAGDAPVISEGNDSASLPETNANHRLASGTLTVTDNDLTDSVNLGMSVSVGGTSTATHPANADLLAMLSLTPVNPVLSDGSTISSQVSWTFDSGNTQTFDYLAAGETLVLTYTVTATDTGNPALATSSTVIVTLIGSNDSPTLAQPTTITLTDTVNADTLANTAGSLSGSDVDHNAVLSYGIAGQSSGTTTINSVDYNVSKAGRYGTLYLASASGSYVYVPDTAAIEALKANTSEQFSVWASDGSETATQSLVINLTATNDTPALSASLSSTSFTDTAADDRFSTVIGRLTASDRDAGETTTFDITGASADTSRSGFDRSLAGSYGQLYLNSATGAYTYVPNDAAINALTGSASDSFTLKVTDGSNASVSQTLSLTYTGANDPVVISLRGNDSTVARLNEPTDNSALSASGTLSVSDRDTAQTATASVASVAIDGSLTGSVLTSDALKAMMSVDSGAVITNTANDGTIHWSFAAPAGTFDYLATGQTLTLSYTLRASDSNSPVATADQTVTVIVTGSNDGPVVTNSAGALVGSVTEAGHADDGTVVAGTPTATGTLSSSDVDANATRTWTLQGTPSTTYGSIVLDATTGVWIYTLDNSLATTQALKEGQSVTQTYVARATDDFGAYVDQTLTLTINGTNDVPVVTNASSALVGSVTEAGHADDGTVVAGTPTATGTLSSSDVDANATRTWTLQGTPSTTYGSIVLDATTGVWIYTLDNSLATTQALKEGQSVTQTYVARATDDFGAYVDQTITVTINGTNDVPFVVGALQASAYLEGEWLSVPTAQLFSDLDLDAGAFGFSATLPPGLQIGAQSGVISGAGTRPGDYDIVIRATDAQGAWVETHWAVRINAPAETGNTTGTAPTPSGSGDGTTTDGSFGSGGSGSSGSDGFDSLNDGIPGFTSTIPVLTYDILSTPNTNTSGGLGSGLTDPGTSGSGATFGTITDPGTSTSTTDSGATSITGEGARSTTPDSRPQEDPNRTEASVGSNGQLQLRAPDRAADQPANDDSTRRSVERIDVAVGINGQISLRQQAPQGNETSTGIMLVEVAQQQHSLHIEIADFRRSQVAQYRATLPDGRPLPSWIKVDPVTGRLTAEPGADVQLIELTFIAQDADGSIRTIEIKIDLSQQNQRTEPSPASTQVMETRPVFMSQLAAQRQQWDGYGEQLLSIFTE